MQIQLSSVVEWKLLLKVSIKTLSEAELPLFN